MAEDIFYKGNGGLLDVLSLNMRDKAGTGAPIIRPQAGQFWTAGGMSMPVQILQLARTLLISEMNTLFHGFNASSPVITLPAITEDGIPYKFMTNSNGVLRIDPNASNNIVYSGGAMTNGEFLDIENSSSLFIISSGTSWIAFRETGTFTEETP